MACGRTVFQYKSLPQRTAQWTDFNTFYSIHCSDCKMPGVAGTVRVHRNATSSKC